LILTCSPTPSSCHRCGSAPVLFLSQFHF
jgi:hypothetical protein